MRRPDHVAKLTEKDEELWRRARELLGGEARLRFDRLESLGARLREAVVRGEVFVATLGGVLLRLDSAGQLTLSPAPARRGGGKSPGLDADNGKS